MIVVRRISSISAKFKIKERNTLCEQRSALRTVQDCKQAANLLNKPWKTIVTNRYYPRGCYLETNIGGVYWNKHHTGHLSVYAAPICYKNNSK